MSETRPASTALFMSTFAFTVCFAVWVINAVLVTYLVGAGVFAFDAAQIGWLLALPTLTGALTRVPLGILTDRHGGRIVFFLLMLAVAVPLFLLSYATSYSHFLLASLGFGVAGGSFAVGVGYVSCWFDKSRQGTALGIFGVGNAGAAVTTLLAPTLLDWFTDGKSDLENWRLLPKVYAGLLVITALLFFALTRSRRPEATRDKSLGERLAPLKSVVVWRFGLYYFLVFGGFVTLAQWIVPYATNVYGLSLASAGLIASAFSLPSGLIRAAGGWLSDRFGARRVMYWVFASCILSCLVLAVPKMEISSPGEGVSATASGIVTEVRPTEIRVADKRHPLTPIPDELLSRQDDGSRILPGVQTWHEPAVKVGDAVTKKQLLARGISTIYYPANIWLFLALIIVIGVATGIGKAAVYKFIPDQFPDSVGAVGGMVGLIGALGGFVFPPLFGYLLRGTGLWSSCWIALLFIALACLVWMELVSRRIMEEEVPELVDMVERRPDIVIGMPLPHDHEHHTTIQDCLAEIPFFAGLGREQLKLIAELGTRCRVAGGETLFSEGDQGETLFVILRGKVRIHRLSPRGNPVEVATLEAGDFFGEIALLDGGARSAAATTLEDCDFLVLQRRDFLTQLAGSPRMLGVLLSGLSKRLRRSVSKMRSHISYEKIDLPDPRDAVATITAGTPAARPDDGSGDPPAAGSETGSEAGRSQGDSA